MYIFSCALYKKTQLAYQLSFLPSGAFKAKITPSPPTQKLRWHSLLLLLLLLIDVPGVSVISNIVHTYVNPPESMLDWNLNNHNDR